METLVGAPLDRLRLRFLNFLRGMETGVGEGVACG